MANIMQDDVTVKMMVQATPSRITGPAKFVNSSFMGEFDKISDLYSVN